LPGYPDHSARSLVVVSRLRYPGYRELYLANLKGWVRDGNVILKGVIKDIACEVRATGSGLGPVEISSELSNEYRFQRRGDLRESPDTSRMTPSCLVLAQCPPSKQVFGAYGNFSVV
jgi:hypothetical protein